MIRAAIEKIIDEKMLVQIDKAKVISVNGSVAKVQSLTTDKTFFKCSLNAVLDNDTSELTIVPEIGSIVIIGIFNNQASILQTSKVKSLSYKYQDTFFKLSGDGMQLTRNGQSLKAILKTEHEQLSSLCDAVNAIVVLPGYGTGPNVPTVTNIKTEVETNKSKIDQLLQ
jgi:hypothetical protein